MTIKTTVNWWYEASELSDRQSENLNGGSGFASVSIFGGLDNVQINEGNSAQINIRTDSSSIQYRNYRKRHGSPIHYFF